MNKLAPLIFLLFSFTLCAQEYKSVKSAEEVKSKIRDKSNMLNTLTANFTETVHSSVLTSDQVAKGKVYYQSENKIRWEKYGDTKDIILIDGSNISFFVDGSKVENSGANKIVKRVQSLMMDVISSDFIDKNDFSIDYLENNSNYKLILKPLKKNLSRYVSNIELVFDKEKMSLMKFTIYESEDDFVSYKFSSVIYNKPISSTTFKSL